MGIELLLGGVKWQKQNSLVMSLMSYIQGKTIYGLGVLTGKNAQPESWKLGFIWHVFWGLQVRDTEVSDHSEGLLQRGKGRGRAEYIGVFATKTG